MYFGSVCATKCLDIRLIFYDIVKHSPVGGVLPGGGAASIKGNKKLKIGVRIK